MDGDIGRSRDEAGFTLLELTIALGLAALVFSALAQTMFASLRTLSVQKTRNQGNEVAAQAIEDLQRFGYANLGLCAAAPARTGFSNTSLLPNCPAGATPTYGTDPCSGAVGQVQVPKPVYDCTRGATTYTVNRYVVWTDASRTAKRLAVFVTWRDQVGVHEVAQQSSVRAPGVANVIGLSAPVLTNASVTPTIARIVDGVLQEAVLFSVSASGLVASDRVVAGFNAVDASGVTQPTSVALTSTNGSAWTGSIPAGSSTKFAVGSQFFTISALRAADSKATAIVTPSASKFCPPTDVSCESATLPTFSGLPTVPSSVGIDAAGALKQDVTVSIATKNVASNDNVSVAVVTASGLLSVLLQAQPGCTFEACTWRGTILRSAGYSFLPGKQPFFFTAEQYTATDTAARTSTTATASGLVTFG